MAKLIQLTMNLKDGVTKPFQQIRNQTKQTTKGFDVLKGKMKGLEMAFKGFIGAMAIGQIVDFGKELHQAWETQRKAEQAVNDSIYSNMKARGASQVEIDKEVQAYKDMASQLQSVGVIGDEVTLSGMAMMTQMNLTAEQVKELTPLVQDLAVKQNGVNVTQESFTDVSKDVANMVNMGKLSLQKYGIQVTDTEKKAYKAMNTEQRYAFVVNKLKNNVAGMNKKLAETPEGKIARVNNEIGDMKEQLGKQLDLAIEPLLNPLLNAVKWLNNDLPNIIGSVKQFSIDIYNEYKPYFDVFNDILRVWKSAFDGFIPYVQPILSDLKTMFGGAFKFIMSLIKLDFGGMWSGIKDIVSGACSAISDFVSALRDSFTNAFAEMIGKGEEWREEQARLKAQAEEASKIGTAGSKYYITKGVGVANPSEHNALGTSYFKGGLTHINERNQGEVVNLPNGSQIIPHDVAVKQSNVPVYNVSVNIQGNVIGNEEYVNDIGNSIVQKLQLSMNNI